MNLRITVIAYLIKRLLNTVLIIWAAVTLAFAALRLIPGDAIGAQLLQGGASAEEIEARRAALGLDAPPLEQYLIYIAGLARGDMGVSLLDRQPVTQMIARQIPNTAALALAALSTALTLGLGLGIAGTAARWAGVRRLSMWLAALALGMPVYWTGTLAIWLFSVTLGWLPATGAGDLRHLILPAGVLGFHVSGSIARVTQASLLEARAQNFVPFARSKGLSWRQVWRGHILRVGLLPVITVAALQAGFLLGGTVIVETLFARSGLGGLLLRAILERDLPVVQGVVVLAALIYSIVNTAADLLYALADPRVRLESEELEFES
ncbi:MAG: ABC transporter permease [Anaerolineae bacterium]|nr:ABC transporter permease [Anaerolineae bacterium]